MNKYRKATMSLLQAAQVAAAVAVAKILLLAAISFLTLIEF